MAEFARGYAVALVTMDKMERGPTQAAIRAEAERLAAEKKAADEAAAEAEARAKTPSAEMDVPPAYTDPAWDHFRNSMVRRCRLTSG